MTTNEYDEQAEFELMDKPIRREDLQAIVGKVVGGEISADEGMRLAEAAADRTLTKDDLMTWDEYMELLRKAEQG